MSRRVEALKALRTRLQTVTLTNWTVRGANRSDPTAAEPTVGEQFIEETPFGDATVDAGVGAGRFRRTTGTYQLMLCVPVDTGLKSALTLLDALDTAFASDTLMTLTDGTPLLVQDVFIGEPRRDPNDAWVRIPFVLTYDITAQ